MVQKLSLYILIVLTFIQSTDAIADAKKIHQPNSEYSEADYFPNSVFKFDSSDLNTNTPKQINNTDHCCSCHGITTMLILSNELFFKASISQNDITDCINLYLSQLITPDIRPPIV